MRVLVVEDDQSLQEQLVENLTKRGFAVDATDNGTDALYFGTEYPIDLSLIHI